MSAPTTAAEVMAMTAAELRTAAPVGDRPKSTGCAGCTDCTDCTGCRYCAGCADCYKTNGLRCARHVVLGMQLTREQWEAIVATLGADS